MTYTTSEVARITGVTLRQLQWWDERNIVTPLLLGHQRQYSVEDLFAVAVVRDLSARGFSMQRISRLWRGLRKRNAVPPNAVQHGYMLTDGKSIKLLAYECDVIALLSEVRKPAFVLVPLAAISARLAVDAPRALAVMPDRVGPGRAETLRRPVREAQRA